jgi:biopolymer transport protein TolQ
VSLRPLLTAFLLQAAAQGWDNSILTIISRSGLVAKGVLVLLLFFSIVSWAIIADRFFAFRRTRSQNGQFYRLFRKANSMQDVANTAMRYRSSVFARMYLMVFNELQPRNDSPSATVKSLAPMTHQMIDRIVSRAGISEQTKMEKNLSFLATTASATPFIGLFGTVWGIINAFESIGGARSTDLSVVAPGIAEALIATAMGLAAAIPAVIGYNFFIHNVRAFASEMEEFSMELLTFVEHHQVVK